jgi:Uma2 family endonuclease
MTATKKINFLSIEEFQTQFLDSRCQYHEGEVWQLQATTPTHNNFQGAFAEILRSQFHKKTGGTKPGGWWILPEAAVRYGTKNLFSHDLAGWQRSRVPQIPEDFPVLIRPDWVCEILSSNASNDLVKKKAVLHEFEVPFYWIVDPVLRILNVLEWSEKGYTSVLDVTEDFVGKIPPFGAVELNAFLLFGGDENV